MTVFPTGVTIYDRNKAWNGFTLYPSPAGALLIDMNGRAVRLWPQLTGIPVRAFPGGYVMGSYGKEPGAFGRQSSTDTVELNWNGDEVWHFNRNEVTDNIDGEKIWSGRQHHDWQREGSGCGYYSPFESPLAGSGNTLLLTRSDRQDSRVSEKRIIDERIIEVSWNGKIVWEWSAACHVDELGLSDAERKAISDDPADGDWIHLNAVSVLGQNRWFEEGDSRFNPDNIICSARQLNEIFIIEKSSGHIVWSVGPDFSSSPALMALGQFIGQHGVHMIPRGLPGEGNILLFDNGSFGGWGEKTAVAPRGFNTVRRHYSRIVEFNPVTLSLEWEYSHAVRHGSCVMELGANTFLSPYISFAQRLENGNTLVTEGSQGRVFELTREKEIVWEFVNPLERKNGNASIKRSIYRAYRIPYSWMPQAGIPDELSVIPPSLENFRVPGSCLLGNLDSVMAGKGTRQ